MTSDTPLLTGSSLEPSLEEGGSPLLETLLAMPLEQFADWVVQQARQLSTPGVDLESLPCWQVASVLSSATIAQQCAMMKHFTDLPATAFADIAHALLQSPCTGVTTFVFANVEGIGASVGQWQYGQETKEMQENEVKAFPVVIHVLSNAFISVLGPLDAFVGRYAQRVWSLDKLEVHSRVWSEVFDQNDAIRGQLEEAVRLAFTNAKAVDKFSQEQLAAFLQRLSGPAQEIVVSNLKTKSDNVPIGLRNASRLRSAMRHSWSFNGVPELDVEGARFILAAPRAMRALLSLTAEERDTLISFNAGDKKNMGERTRKDVLASTSQLAACELVAYLCSVGTSILAQRYACIVWFVMIPIVELIASMRTSASCNGTSPIWSDGVMWTLAGSAFTAVLFLVAAKIESWTSNPAHFVLTLGDSGPANMLSNKNKSKAVDLASQGDAGVLDRVINGLTDAGVLDGAVKMSSRLLVASDEECYRKEVAQHQQSIKIIGIIAGLACLGIMLGTWGALSHLSILFGGLFDDCEEDPVWPILFRLFAAVRILTILGFAVVVFKIGRRIYSFVAVGVFFAQ